MEHEELVASGAIDRGKPPVEVITGEGQTLQFTPGEDETEEQALTRGLLISQIMSRAQRGAAEGTESVPEIEADLVANGEDPAIIRQSLVEGLQPKLLEMMKKDEEGNSVSSRELQLQLIEQYGYPDDLVADLFPDDEEPLTAYKMPELVPISDKLSVSDEELASITASMSQLRVSQLDTIGELGSYIAENKVGLAVYKRKRLDSGVAIANGLRRLGKNVTVDSQGNIIDSNGKDIQSGLLLTLGMDIGAAKYEVLFAAGGGAANAARANMMVSKLGIGKGKARIIWGLAGILGGGAFGSIGAGVDTLSNALVSREQIDANLLAARMKEAGIVSIGGELIVGMGVLTVKGVWRTYDSLLRGNRVGAFRSLKDLFNMTDEEIEKTLTKWEALTGTKLKGSLGERAIQVIPTTQPGGQSIVVHAAGKTATGSKQLIESINVRSKELTSASEALTSGNLNSVLKDEFDKYIQDVDDLFFGVRDIAADQLRTTAYKFDFDKLALKPLMAKINKNIMSPIFQDSLESYVKRMKSIGAIKGTDDAITTVTRKFTRSGPKEQVIKKAGKKAKPSQLRSFGDLLDLRKTLGDFKANAKIVDRRDKAAVNNIIRTLDTEISKVSRSEMVNGDVWLKAWKGSLVEQEKLYKVKENVMYNALTAKGVNPEETTAILTKYINSGDKTFNRALDRLPERVRASAEGAVLDAFVKKNTISGGTEWSATNFAALAKDLKAIGFKSPEAKKLRLAINEIGEVFKNDISLAQATGQINVPGFQHYLTTDPIARVKYEVANQAFDYVKRLFPTERGRTVALVTNVARLLEKPTNSKFMQKLLNSVGNDPEMTVAVKRLALEVAKRGEQDISPNIPIFRAGIPGSIAKMVDGKWGKGRYWSIDKKTTTIKSNVVKGKVIESTILPSRIATEQTIKELAGLDSFNMKQLKGNSDLIELLKKNNYKGVAKDDAVFMFE